MKKPMLVALVAMAVIIAAMPSRASTYTQAQKNKALAHEIAEMLRAEGHEEDHPVIVACQEWWQSEDASEAVCVAYTTKEQRAKYPVAASDWQILREAGLSEVCAAAIIGNYMAETGGHTLDYDPYLRVGGFYGKAMWSEEYFPEIVGMSSIEQTEFTIATLEQQFGNRLQAFLQETDVRKAARMFSDYYERPAAWSEKRADNAEAAYRFFCG